MYPSVISDMPAIAAYPAKKRQPANLFRFSATPADRFGSARSRRRTFLPHTILLGLMWMLSSVSGCAKPEPPPPPVQVDKGPDQSIGLEARLKALEEELKAAKAAQPFDTILPELAEKLQAATFQVRGGSGGSAFAVVDDNDNLILLSNHHVATTMGFPLSSMSLVVDPQNDISFPTSLMQKTCNGKVGFSPIGEGFDLAILTPPEDPQLVQELKRRALRLRTTPLKPGEPVAVCGNPHSWADSVTAGIVSGIYTPSARNEAGELICNGPAAQIDAAVNPGNSGGPMMDREGRVAGIISASYSPKDRQGFTHSDGMGFALLPDQLIIPFLRDRGYAFSEPDGKDTNLLAFQAREAKIAALQEARVRLIMACLEQTAPIAKMEAMFAEKGFDRVSFAVHMEPDVKRAIGIFNTQNPADQIDQERWDPQDLNSDQLARLKIVLKVAFKLHGEHGEFFEDAPSTIVQTEK